MFANGEKTYMAGKVFCFWSWNGKITQAGITEQLEDFAAGRFDGVIVHARAGLLVGYLSEEWFSLFGHTVREAERLSLEVFIYDEDGWPSGFAGGLVPNAAEEYRLRIIKNGTSKAHVPEKHLIAAYRDNGNGEYSELSFEKSEDGDLFIWYELDPDYVDLMSEKTVRKFIDTTHEEYRRRFSEYFGTVIKGVFTDEPQFNNYLPWSPVLDKVYSDAFGETLRPLMWMLTVDKGDYRKFRARYYSVVREQFSCAFTKQIGDWCSENGLLFTGHFGCEDGLCNQLGSNGGVMQQYPFMHLPGIDHLGNRTTSPILVKQAASASRQFGDGSVLSETFGCSGWDAELPRLAWLWGRQVSLGVTTACCHLSAYSIMGVRKRDYPAFFSHQSPFWRVFGSFKEWMTTLSDLMSEGERAVDTLVISPLNTAAAYYNGSLDSERMRNCSAQFRMLAENLLDLQLDFDIGDEELISRHAYIESGKLCLGNCSYSTVFVSSCESLLFSVWDKLNEFAASGGRVVFVNHRPDMSDFSYKEDAFTGHAVTLENRRELIEKYLLRSGIRRKVRLLNNYDLSTMTGHILHTRNIASGCRVQICGREDSDTVALFQIEGEYALLRRALSGGEDEILSCTHSAGMTYAELRIGRMENLVIDAVSDEMQSESLQFRASECLLPRSVRMTDKNCLTLDRARYIIDEKCSEEMPVIKITPFLYELASKRKSALETELVYSFSISGDVAKMGLTLALEADACESFSVNGHSVSSCMGGWIDAAVKEYDISSLAVSGENTVSVKYIIGGERTALNEDEIFETQRNRFFFPTEPESIYIRGNFDIIPVGDYINRLDHIRTNGEFVLTDSTEKSFGELTKQGLWFYRGDALYSFQFECEDLPDKCVLRLGNAHFAAFEWELNGCDGTVVTYPTAVDITDAVCKGKNELKLRIIGTNRNLLGPHHHIKGRNMFVGVHTFTGVYGFEDFVSPEIVDPDTWTDEYSFVPFDCGKVTLEMYRKEEER